MPDTIQLPREVAGILMTAAEVRLQQFERYISGLDPYSDDCIHECDEEEATNMVQMYRDALEAFNKAKQG